MKYLILLILLSGNIFAFDTIEFNTDNLVQLNTEVNETSVKNVISKLLILNEIVTEKPIYLFIDTPGGNPDYGLLLIDIINDLKRPLFTVSKNAFSMGFILVQEIKTRRYILENALFLTHPVRYQNLFIDDTLKNHLEKDIPQTISIYINCAKRMKITDKEYMELMKKEVYFQGNNIIRMNMADEIINFKCSMDLLKSGNCPIE